MEHNTKLSSIDFNKLGMEVTNLYIAGKTPTLLAGVLELSKKYDLNNNGVKRLSEKANHFMQMYILKYVDDKKKEFKVVDPDEAVYLHAKNRTDEILAKEASTIVNNKYEETIPNFVEQADLKKANVPFNKVASIYNTNNMKAYKELLYKRAAIKDKINSIMLDKMASTLTMNDIVEHIYNEFNTTTAPSFKKIAYDIYNKYKDESYPFIKNMCINLNTPIDDSFKKEAADNGSTIIDDTTPTMTKMSSFIDAQRLYFSSDKAVASYKEELNKIEEAIRTLGGI